MPPENFGTKESIARHRLQVAKEDLAMAQRLFNEEEYRFANNRSYYAIFHAINAVHALDGVSYKRHRDTVGRFNKDYVKTGIFPRDYGGKIARAQRIREASDYEDFFFAAEESAAQQVAFAQVFVSEVDSYCENRIAEGDDSPNQG